MSGTRRCKAKSCKVRIPSNEQFCEDHTQVSDEAADSWNKVVYEVAQEIMTAHAPLLQNLAEHEAGEKILVKNMTNISNGVYELGGTKHDAGKPDLTLPTDSNERKEYPLLRGCLRYFPAALAGVAHISKLGNDKHNPGEALHHARGKSMDHGDCLLRHLVDLQDLLAQDERSALTPLGVTKLKEEVSCLAWRALAYSQELHEKFGAPLAPGAVIK